MGLLDGSTQAQQGAPQGGLFGGDAPQMPQQGAQSSPQGAQLAQSLLSDPSQQNAQKIAQMISSKGTPEAQQLGQMLMQSAGSPDAVRQFGQMILQKMGG